MSTSTAIKSKLEDSGLSIFSIMSQLANETGAINLSQGFPDFEGSPKLIELVSTFMKKGYNQYAPMPGLINLREEIAEKVFNTYNHTISPEREITITAGATQAIYTAITSVIRKDDEVILFEPAYDCYVPAIKINGGIPVHIALSYPDYKINWNEVKNKINPKTKMIIINTPHNPAGTTLSASDLLALEALVKETNILVLSDEVYEHIIFDKEQHESVLKYPSLYERSFAIFSFGKTYHHTGWKMGYCIAPAYLTKLFRSVHQYLVFSVNTPIQHALAEFMKDKSEYKSLGNFYQQKRDYFNTLLKNSKFEIIPSKGTYFQLLGYKNISAEKDTDFAIRLTKEYGVASVPMSVFFKSKQDDKVLRFCFAKKAKTLEKAAEKLCKI